MRKYLRLTEALEPRRLFTAGSLDASFNQVGTALVGFGQQFDTANAVARQADGRLIVAGTTSSNTTGLSSFALARLNPDGTLDTSFGNAGLVQTSFGAGSSANTAGVAVLSTGQILVGGYVTQNGQNNLALARYNTNGTLDTSFGGANTGLLVRDAGGTSEAASAFLVDSTDRIYLAGTNGAGTSATFLVARLNPDGTFDTSFGETSGGARSGIASVAVPGGSGAIASLALAPDGSLVAGGFRDVPQAGGGALSDFAVARFTSAGDLDTTFNGSGFYVTDFSGANQPDEVLGVAVQPDGRVLAAGFTGNTLPRSGASRFAILRLNTNGTPDTTFANNGRFTGAPASARFEALDTITVLGDGSILAAGTYGDPNAPAASPDAINSNFALLRLTSSGAVDPAFGSTEPGLATADVSGNFDEARSILVLPDGRVVVAGFAGNASQQGGGGDFGVAQFLTSNTNNLATVFGPDVVAQGQNAVFTVNLAQPATTAVTLNYATANGTAAAGTDYTTTTGTLTFAPGQSAQTITIPALTAAGNTGGRNLTLTVSNPAGTPAANAYTLTNATRTLTVLGSSQTAPQPVIAINNVSVIEPVGTNTATAVFTVSLDRPAASAVTITYATANVSALAGSDYTATTGTLTIPTGSTTATISVPILSDTTVEQPESFVVNLTNPANAILGATNQGIATITDPANLPTIGLNTVATVNEGLSVNTVAQIPVTLSSAAAAPVTIVYSVTAGTAQEGSDFAPLTNGTVTIPAGATTGVLPVTIRPDLNVEGAETFTVTINSVSGATLNADRVSTVTIVDATFHTVTFGGRTRAIYTDASGDRVTVSLSGPGSGTLVFPGASPATPPVRGVLQEGRDADSIRLTGTSPTASRLTITASGRRGAGTSFSAIVADASLNSISGSTTDLNGLLSVATGSLNSVTLRNLSNTTATIGSGGPTIRLTSISNSLWRTGGSIRSLITGTVSNTTFDVAGDLLTFSASSGVSNSTISAGNRISAVTANQLVSSRVLAGTALTTTTAPAVGATSIFTNPLARIDRVTVRGSRVPAAFSNSLIIAPNLGTLSLGVVALAAPTTPGTPTQGVFFDTTLRSVTFRDPSQRRSTVVRNSPATDQTVQDFTVRNV